MTLRAVLGKTVLVVTIASLLAFAIHSRMPRRASSPLLDFNIPDVPDPNIPPLIDRYQCNRCHDGGALFKPASLRKNCVACHQSVFAGAFDGDYSADRISTWKKHIVHLLDSPSLIGIEARFKRDWFISFLLSPKSIRPSLHAMMPRLAISPSDAEKIAQIFYSSRKAPRRDESQGDLVKGRRVLDEKGCGNCHQFSGVKELSKSSLSVSLTPEAMAQAIRLAPDFRYTRERMDSAAIVRWLENPKGINPKTVMPMIPLTEDERMDAAAYILRAPLTESTQLAVPTLPPPLERNVSFREVQAKVFKKICWHCHSDPAPVGGDGGPGNTGGYGYHGKGLDLSSYEGIIHGIKGEHGERISILQTGPDNLPKVVRHLMARHSEISGVPVSGVLGMPLGLPPIPIEDIQLVQTWISQGAPH